MKRIPPFFAILLMIVMFIQSTGALYGGIALILEPEGGLLKMPVAWLGHSPFSDYLIPGIILMLLLGIFPLFTLISLIWRPRWKVPEYLNLYKGRNFSWSYSLYIGIMLMTWITVQIYMVGYGSILQTIFATIGILIIILTLVPSVMNYYQQPEQEDKGKWRTL